MNKIHSGQSRALLDFNYLRNIEFHKHEKYIYQNLFLSHLVQRFSLDLNISNQFDMPINTKFLQADTIEIVFLLSS